MLISNQTHVDAAGSAESFAQMFKFFAGQDPSATDIVMGPPGRVYLEEPINGFVVGMAAGLKNRSLSARADTGCGKGRSPAAAGKFDTVRFCRLKGPP